MPNDSALMDDQSAGRAALWRAAAACVRAGTPAALATVARRRGSLPMASDAKMLVTEDLRRWGTIGGGCLEADVTAQALETLASGRPALVRHSLNADIAGDLGLSCGGTVELFVEPLPAGRTDLADALDAVSGALRTRAPAVVLTPLEWDDGPRKAVRTGDREIVVGAWRPPAIGEPSGGAYLHEEARTFVEPVPRAPRLVIFGAGHVGREIARVAAGTEFCVVVTDDRAEFANRERFPHAAEILVDDPRGVLDTMAFDADDYIIVATRGHRMDAVIVERVAQSPARYVGMLGSRRKRAVIWKALATAGVPQAALERVRVPIGLEIGADTPGEIGVSVMAELIRLRRSPAEPREQRAERIGGQTAPRPDHEPVQ